MRRVLLVAGSPTGSRHLVSKLAEAADWIIAIDGGASLCVAADVLPDRVVGDLDSLSLSHQDLLRAQGVPFATYPQDKDETDLDLALAELHRQAVDEIVATAVLGGRIDHALVALGSLARCEVVGITIREDDMSGAIMRPNGTASLELRGAGSTVSLLPLLGPAVVTCSGMRWPLEEATLQPLDSLGVSNVVAQDCARVIVHQGTILLVTSGVDGVPPAQFG